MHILRCPYCKSTDIDLYMGGQFGKYQCKKCGYVGNLIVEEINNKKTKMKNISMFKMKFWNVVNWVAGACVILLVGSILFAPLPMLAQYGFTLFMIVIGLGLVSLLHSLIVFVNETPERKWGEQKQPPKQPKLLNIKLKTWKSIGEWTLTLVIFILLLQFQHGNLGSKECPDIVRGNPNGINTVQYFYSPFCLGCWKGETILEGLIAKYPKVRFENYDTRYCRDAAIKAGVRGSTAYFVKNMNASEVIYGLDAEQIENTVCRFGACS